MLPIIAEGTFWLPEQSSTIAAETDWLFMFIYWLSVGFFVPMMAAMVLFTFVYKRKKGVEPVKSASHGLALELTWSIIPFLIVLFLFYQGFAGYVDRASPPSDSYPITVMGKKWSWSFVYPNQYLDNVLHVPVNQPVELKMTSEDVVHSLYIPAFRVKRDVMPYRYTSLWFNATKPGEYNLFCAEYCGQQHSDMITKVVVHAENEFEPWLAKASDIFRDLDSGKKTMAEIGEMLYLKRGCAQCHTVDGTVKTGPSFKGSFGTDQQVTVAGAPTTVKIDENYLLESIKDPAAKVRAGFKNQMPTVSNMFKEEREYHAIIEYIKSLNQPEK